MFKRAFWFGSGVVVGAGGTVWTTVRLRRAVAQVTPGGVADQALSRARRVGSEVRDAVAEGRLVMRETEATLRSELTPPSLEAHGRGAIDVAEIERVESNRRNAALVSRRREPTPAGPPPAIGRLSSP